VWDYPRPPRIEADARTVRVEWAGLVLAETDAAVRVLETASPPTFYIPPGDVRTELLEPSWKRTMCEWKGVAGYWDARHREHHAPLVAWSYAEPTPRFEEIRDYLAFFAGRVDACYVGRERVTPQPGGFYGGWITPEVLGPFKGEPGTLHW
jgi:uncharacterized protein (DUF427 family)